MQRGLFTGESPEKGCNLLVLFPDSGQKIRELHQANPETISGLIRREHPSLAGLGINFVQFDLVKFHDTFSSS